MQMAFNSAKKAKVEVEEENDGEEEEDEDCPPEDVDEFRQRLLDQGKELFKDPPKMPILNMVALPKRQRLPRRRNNGDIIFIEHQEFCPNVSPAEVLQSGAFGGTYFRELKSAVTNRSYTPSDVINTTVPLDWIKGLTTSVQLCSQIYRREINKFGVICGDSMGKEESCGWISDLDPYGWF